MSTTPTPDTLDEPARTRRHFRLFLLLALLLLGAGIGLRDPWPSDEPRFTLVAKQMVESGDWLFPHRGRELYSDKPPMLMWMEAAAYQVTGQWRVAFLLPSLLAGLLTLTLTYDLGRRLFSARAGLYAAIAVLFAFQFMYQGKRAQIDPLITSLVTLANWGLLLHFLRGPDWRAYWLGCFAAGLGVITKGVGVLALLMFLPYVFARVRGWDHVNRMTGEWWRWLAGPLAFLAAIALWLVPMLLAAQARSDPAYAAYVDDILFRQTAKRYADSWSHLQPAWYFGPILLFNWFPLSLAYAGVLKPWWQALKAKDARILLPLAWTALIVLFFSIPDGKRDVYIMPALPMVALAMAPWLETVSQRLWLRRAAFALTLLGGLYVAGFGVWALTAESAWLQAKLAGRGLDAHGTAPMLLVIAIGLVLLASAAWARVQRGLHGMLLGLAGLWLLYSFGAYPLLNDSNSAAGIMRRAGELIGPDAELGLVAWKEQNLLMADRKVADFGFKHSWHEQFVEATQWQAAAPGRWIFTREDAMDDCVQRARAQLVGKANRREWWVFPAEAVVPGCIPDAKGTHEAEANRKEDPP